MGTSTGRKLRANADTDAALEFTLRCDDVALVARWQVLPA